MGSCEKKENNLLKNKMDIQKEIRETIAFYCGGTQENKQLATEKILQKIKEKQLTLTDVVSSACKKAEIIEVLNNRRKQAFDNQFHKYENNEMKQAIDIINRLLPDN